MNRHRQGGGAPFDHRRRSAIYREHLAAGAEFGVCGGELVVQAYGDGPEHISALQLGMADLSTHPRAGFRGATTGAWLERLGLRIPDAANRAIAQNDGSLLLRLSEHEFLLLAPLVPEQEGTAWQPPAILPGAEATPLALPRRESHALLALTGAQAPNLLAKLCGVDLRLHRFIEGRVAQTSVARVDSIVVRYDLGAAPGFFLLFDSCSSQYLWHCILDAMQEFGGTPVGLRALVQLASGAV